MNANFKLVPIISIIFLFLLSTHSNSASWEASTGTSTPSELLAKVARAIEKDDKELLLSCYHFSTKDEQALANAEAQQHLFSNKAKKIYNLGTSKFGKEPFLNSLGSFRYILENQVKPNMYLLLSNKGNIDIKSNTATISYSDKQSSKTSRSHFKVSIKLELIDGRWYFTKPTGDVKQTLKEIESLTLPAYRLLSGITPLISEASDITEFKKMINPLIEKYKEDRGF